ncbi:glycoside hydrolase family 2 protein [Spirochaetales bacterium NM-380-WT-3C1]|uniref:Glycoside hydrolase family 2 protein n=1 Tax=Bullifex porci TaxID=2606638 RepID=A0A7X2PCX8_9SPIO|nr:glycoside hydrolase family 2 TIM barrel-domain containing protein [Bullifex porci]MSU06085.1 glycoside hydrolase family 2 protein [Bullifex porci]
MRIINNINALWAFRKTEEVPASFDKSWDIISLPHTWNNIDGMDGGNDYFRGKGTYVKVLSRENLPSDKLNYLEINGASSSADVFFNGEKLTHHDGGYSTFRALLPAAIKDENILVIQVDNSPNDRVYPQMADFTFYGGLYRDVNIISVPKAHFDLEYYGAPGVMATPHVEGSIDVKVFVKDQGDESIIYTLLDKENNVVTSLETKATEVSLKVKEPHLWNGRKDPYLYTLRCSLTGGDEITTRVGFRAFEIDPERGFILNGEEYPLRGVSRHQDRWGKGNAISREDHEEDMALIMEVGATTIRLAHYQHDQYFYDLCDENGLVIWAEIPYISSHMVNGRENTISQMRELISQNYNHPSIVVWGVSNEITMNNADDPDLLENHRILIDLAHEMDKTRLTTMAALTMCNIDSKIIHLTDVVSYNHYFGWYGGDVSMNGPWFDNFHKKYPNRPIGCSEYGCEALNWHTSKPIQGDYTEEYQAYYHEELIKQFFSRKYLWATHVWNMFDFGADARAEGGENGQNHKGLVTIDRKYKKDSFYAYKAWLSKEPFVHLCSKRYVDRVEPRTKVTVYSNLPEVALYVNGELVETKKAEDHFFHFEIENKGESHIRAVAGEFSDESVIKKVDTFNESYRLKEKGAILNWFDITEKEGYFSINDKMSDIMANEGGRELLSKLMSSFMGEKKEAMGFKLNPEMMQMMGGFTVIRLCNMLGTMNVKVTKEQLLGLNAMLNTIKK